MSSLEHRYRRLIALYPAGHRQRYQLEMLSTLMDGATENQRTPRPRESIDLVWNAIWLRLNRDGAPQVRDPRWASAATLFGSLGALVISALYLMLPLGYLGWEYRLADLQGPPSFVDRVSLAQGVAWLVIAGLALVGRYRLAAIPAWLTALSAIALPLYHYKSDPTPVVREWTMFVFGVTVAGCLTLAKGRIPWRTRNIVAFGGVTAAFGASVWADALLADVRRDPDGHGYSVDLFGGNFWFISYPWAKGGAIDTVGAVPVLLFLALLALVVWLQYGVDRGLRRRFRAYAWVPFATYVLIRSTFEGWLVSSMRFWPTPVLLTVWQWAGLILVPLATFAVAVVVVRRKDSQQRLIEIGRAHS